MPIENKEIFYLFFFFSSLFNNQKCRRNQRLIISVSNSAIGKNNVSHKNEQIKEEKKNKE